MSLIAHNTQGLSAETKERIKQRAATRRQTFVSPNMAPPNLAGLGLAPRELGAPARTAAAAAAATRGALPTVPGVGAGGGGDSVRRADFDAKVAELNELKKLVEVRYAKQR